MDWAQHLLETDRAYFEAGAALRSLRGAVLAYVPGFEALPAGAVVHRVVASAGGHNPRGWLEEVEEECRHIGLGTARLYLDAPNPTLETSLLEFGYECQAEVGFVQAAGRYPSSVTLEPILSEAGWQQKVMLHSRDDVAPDGHQSDAQLWTDLERHRVAAGYQIAHLAMQRGEVVGAIAFARSGGLYRLKNIVVASAHRRRGVGTAMVRAALTLAHREGMEMMGCFGLSGAAGETLYRSNGFHPVVTQWGWSRSLVHRVAKRSWRSHVGC